ncbi:phage tail assembly protein [Streptomyces sp. NPDC045470]|uniref:phage tail assembly protein n=1 Tax=Streptomyces sp. NPDC045470 TaxID=3155469 RepID=UPI0033E3907F
MTDVLSCADLMAETATEYASLPLATRAGADVHLRNLLMLPPERMKTARVLLNAFADSGVSDLDALMPQLRDLLLLVADQPEAMKAEMADWPIGMYVRVIGRWQDVTQAPEAPGSDG